MTTDLETWALPRLSRLLPLDDASLKDIIKYTITLSKLEGAEHLKNLLGDSPQALDFISSFNSRRTEQKSNRASGVQSEEDVGVPRRNLKASKKSKPPLHSAGPIRRPEGYGDISGAYSRPVERHDFSGPNIQAVTNTNLDNNLQPPSRSAGPNETTSLPSSRDASPALPKIKLPPSASGTLISDHLPNIRTKQSKKPAHSSNTASPNRNTTTATTTSNINDLTSAIAALELSTSSAPRKCPCNASLHPLFTTAPNCLACGKIICALEGLQPCSFCSTPILSTTQVTSMIHALKLERGQQRMSAHNTAISNPGSAGPTTPLLSLTPRSNTPDTSDAEGPPTTAADRARAHRDKLLSYQAQNAQRTRIRDDAADYDFNAAASTAQTQWMSPVQRAAALKKQQKYLREMEEANRPEWERKRTVMSLGIKGGRVVRTFERVGGKSVAGGGVGEDDTDGDEGGVGEGEDGGDQGDDTRNAEAGTHSNPRAKLSENPLLRDGKLVRPVWRDKTAAAGNDSAGDGDRGKGKAKDIAAEHGAQSASERKAMWRRVQDDDEGDNERWILDGGIHGFGNGRGEDDGGR